MHTHKESRPLTEVVVFVEEGDAILELISIKVRLHIGDLNVGLSTRTKHNTYSTMKTQL